MKWLKLQYLEWKIFFGEFGMNTKYHCLCLERNANTISKKIKIAEEVIKGGGTSRMECWGRSIYIKNHKKT